MPWSRHGGGKSDDPFDIRNFPVARYHELSEEQLLKFFVDPYLGTSDDRTNRRECLKVALERIYIASTRRYTWVLIVLTAFIALLTAVMAVVAGIQIKFLLAA